MECGDTPHFVISIWIQIWIWMWSVGLHAVWRHFTFHNIHMDTDMAPCLQISALYTLDIKIDLFKMGTILFTIIQGLKGF